MLSLPPFSPSIYLVAALLLMGAGWAIDHAYQTRKYARYEASINKSAEQAQREAMVKQLSLERNIHELSQGLANAESKSVQAENERDRIIAAGAQRVYVRARCPDSVPPDPTSTHPNNAATTELDPAYRQTLSDLRRSIHSQYEQIVALQAYASLCAGDN